MTSYVRSWLSYASTSLGADAVPAAPKDTPAVDVIEPQNDDDNDDAATIKGDRSSEDEDDDAIPVFPALNSAQRMSSSRSAAAPVDRSKLTDAQLMPPPPLPSLAVRRPGAPSSSNSLAVPSSSLGVPSGSNALGLPPTAKVPTKKARQKVALAPGHGPLDWANLQKSGRDLRGVRNVYGMLPSSAH